MVMIEFHARVAYFGGSFNPPHVGHAMVASWVLWTGLAEEVWLAPTYDHPFGKKLVPYEDRLAMVDDMRRDLGHPGIYVSRAEKEAYEATGEPSFTYQTLSMLREKHPIRTFYPLLGADIVADTSKWKDWDNLVEEFPPIFVNRAGAQATFPGPTFPFMSSTLIRERFKLGQSIEGLLTRRVRNYVEERGLYR